MVDKEEVLARHLKVNPDSVLHEFYCNYYSTDAPGEYLVLTEEEAVQAWEDYLESYISECLLPELPEVAQHYFDCEAWKRDARMDGRGHYLSGYDGEEHEVTLNGTTYYVYRTN